jgi:RNA-binding protein YlmH
VNPNIFHDDESFVEKVAETFRKSGSELYLSDFIFPWEISLCHHAFAGKKLEMDEWGGYDGALRKRFITATHRIKRTMFKVTCFELKPSSMLAFRNRRIVQESLLSVGIIDSKIGDILTGSDSYFVFIESVSKVPEIIDAAINAVEKPPVEILHKRQQNVSGTVSSARLDSICALAFKPSREKIQGLIENGGAMVNYQYAYKPSKEVQENSIISLRGFPRFKLIKVGEITKRGRMPVEVEFID